MSRIAVREERCEMFVTGFAEGSVAWQRAKQDRRKGVQRVKTRSRQPECVSVRGKRVRCNELASACGKQSAVGVTVTVCKQEDGAERSDEFGKSTQVVKASSECELLSARCLLRVGDHGGSKDSSRRMRVGRRKVPCDVSRVCPVKTSCTDKTRTANRTRVRCVVQLQGACQWLRKSGNGAGKEQ